MQTRAQLSSHRGLRLVRPVALFFIAALLLLGAPSLAEPTAVQLAATGATYHVRTDGGDCAQCTGLVDAPYSGSGQNQPCAWSHPFCALPPEGPPRMAGGDTLIIGPGSYMMGYGADGAEGCESDYPWDCFMAAVPSGPDAAHPTRILGAGCEQGCAQPPELWGTERTAMLLNLTGSSNVEIAGLELTDHSGCVVFHAHAGGGSELTCDRDSYPFGAWAALGIYAQDSANVTLRHLNIHGLADTGIRAGRLTDWTVEDVRLVGNGWAGWDGDIDGDDWNSGTLTFRRWHVAWNGCGETYPGCQPNGCWGQVAGGYGDGVGTGATGGHWIIEDSSFLHNTSDGLDLLYARTGSQIEIRRTIAEGNGGNQLKTAGPAIIENTVIVGNCGFFEGQPFTARGDWDGNGSIESAVDNCRAYGNTLSLSLRTGDQVAVTNCTIAGEGDCLVLAESVGSPDGTERVVLRNNILQGYVDYLGGDRTCLMYQEGLGDGVFDSDYSLINGVKNGACPDAHAWCDVPPGLASVAIDAFDAHLLADSPAIDVGTTVGAPDHDFASHARDAQPDLGAYEWQPAWDVSLPLVLGWNLVSLPLTPNSTAILDVLASIDGYYDLVYVYDASDAADPWRVYNATGPAELNDLAAIDETMGVWIHTIQAVTLSIDGSAPVAPAVALKRGWNLVGYPARTEQTVAQALVSIQGRYDMVYAYAADTPGDPWYLYHAGVPVNVNSLTHLQAGLGYWIHATSDTLLTFSSPQGQALCNH